MPQPVRTVTAAPSPAVTVTATATPAPDDVVDPLVAWTVCYSFLTAYAGEHEQANYVIPELRTYDPQWVTVEGSGLKVQISPANYPGDWTCWVTGTLAAPKITQWTTNN